MLAIIAAVLFALAAIFEIAKVALGPISVLFLLLLGLTLLALHLAGIGSNRRFGRR